MIYDGNLRDTTDRVSDRYLTVNSCGYQSKRTGWVTIRKRGRLDYHVLLLLEGVCEVLYEGETVKMTGGDFVLYPPGVEQRYAFVEASSTLWLHFAGTAVPEILESLGLKGGIDRSKNGKNSASDFWELIRLYHQQRHETELNAALLRVLRGLCCGKDGKRVIVPNEIERVLDYMTVHYAENLSLAELAAQTGYSQSRFSHRFSKTVGESPMAYLNRIRLNASKMLLSSRETAVSEAAQIVGFRDPLYFSRAFKKQFGISPSAYIKSLEQ